MVSREDDERPMHPETRLGVLPKRNDAKTPDKPQVNTLEAGISNQT